MRESILILLERAFVGAEALEAPARADLYDAAACLLKASSGGSLHLEKQAQAASRAAAALREAEASQLTFASLLTSAHGQPSAE